MYFLNLQLSSACMTRNSLLIKAFILLAISKGILSSGLLDCKSVPLNAACRDFRLASYYQSRMVLQRGEPGAVLWGFGEANANVTVKIDAIHVYTTVQSCCVWKVTLPAFSAGDPKNISLTSSLNKQLVSRNLDEVLFGDVWLCSGQSNMGFPVKQMFNGSNEIESGALYSQIRLLQLTRRFTVVPMLEPEIEQQWTAPSQETVPEFSGLCWAFGRRINEKLSIPIGLINAPFGGVPIRAWSTLETLEKCIKGFQQNPSDSWTSSVWNAMISPLTKMRIAGVLWYQGEADAEPSYGNINAYKCLFPAMIDTWRLHFDNEKMPFGFVQLSTKDENDFGTPLVRWHQTANYGVVPNPILKNAFMAVAMDLGDPQSPFKPIHPRYKEEVAERAAAGALATFYNFTDVMFMGPSVQLAALNGDNISLTFSEILQVRDRNTSGFEVCCNNSLAISGWNECTAWNSTSMVREQDNQVWLDGTVCNPWKILFLRYAWKTIPCEYLKCPLYGAKSALPAASFIVGIT